MVDAHSFGGSRPGRRAFAHVPTIALVAGVLLVHVAVARIAAAAVLYGVDFGASQIYTIDLGTGAATVVGTTTLIDVGGIAFDDAGTLYGIDPSSSDADLYVLDPVAGTATLVGSTGFGGGEGALVYDAVGGYFYSKANVGGSGGTNLQLMTIDPGTGVGTLIGNMGLNSEADVSGMALLGDGTLIAYDPQSALVDRLLAIDKLSGVASVIGPTADATLTSLGGLAVDPDTGTVYLSNVDSLFEVDPLTGTATLIGAHGASITGLSFQPASACLIGLDLGTTLYDVSAVDGSVSNLRSTGVDRLGGLALSPGGVLYGLRSSLSGDLYTLDIVTGAATLVGPTGIGTREGGLAFDPVSGDLYGTHGVGGGALYTLNTTTGAASVVGVVLDEFGLPIDVSALAFDSAGTLYALKMTTAPEVYRINPVDASVFDRVPIPGFAAGADLGGMAFDDSTGDLYAAIGGQLVVLDPTTGATVALGPTPADTALEVVGPCVGPPSTIAVPSTTVWSTGVLIAGLVLCTLDALRSAAAAARA